MTERLNSFIKLVSLVGLLAFAFIDTQIYSQIPQPTCVCAECNKKCGTGHEKTCSSYSKKSSDGIKDMFEKSMTETASLDNFNVIIENGSSLNVTNKNGFAVKYSIEFDIKNKDEIVTYTCTDYLINLNTENLKLFTAVNDGVITRVMITSAVKAVD